MKTNIFIVIVSSIVLSGLAQAMDATQSSGFHVTPYLWGAGFDGTVGASAGNGRIDVDSGFNELKLAGFMLFGEWRQGPLSLFGDWSYAKVSSDASPPFNLLYSDAEAEVRGHIVQGAAGYALYQDNGTVVDLFGGLRYINVRVGLDLDAGVLLPAASLREDDSWVDAVAGVRGTLPLNQRWRAGWYGDIGGGGSDLTWQASAWLGYRYDWGTLIGGWRHLYADYEKSAIKLDAALTGPFIGADFRF